jgi:hypothetical protein
MYILCLFHRTFFVPWNKGGFCAEAHQRGLENVKAIWNLT